jgi:hypothetical protein
VIHESQLLPVFCGTWDLIPTAAGIIQQIRVPFNTFLDEDVMGKGIYVWGENCSGRFDHGIPLGGRLIHYAVAV